MRVLAIDPRDAFAEIQDSLDDLIEDLTATYTAPARQPEAVSLVKSRATILRHLEDAIAEAEYELLCSLTPDLLERFAEDLRDRREDGVAIDLLLSPAAGAPDPEDRDYDALAGAVRTRRGVTTPVVAVADGDYSLYATRESIAGDSERYGVVFNRSELGFLVSGFFNTVLWTTADAISTDRTDPTFPRKYGTIRRCIADLQALEGPFYATVEGRDVRSGDPRRISGEVVAAELGSSREVATLEVEADGEVVAVGDRVACYEDLEAFEIHVGRDEPPEISR